jgi:hypothetical protein
MSGSLGDSEWAAASRTHWLAVRKEGRRGSPAGRSA